MHIAAVVWRHYSLSSKLGRLLDRHAGIPVGRIAVLEFQMLGGKHGKQKTQSPFTIEVGGRKTPITLLNHREMGQQIARLLLSVDNWDLPKTHPRSRARGKLLGMIETLRSLLDSAAHQEHGAMAIYCYYGFERRLVFDQPSN
jgi:hypothetical protein